MNIKKISLLAMSSVLLLVSCGKKTTSISNNDDIRSYFTVEELSLDYNKKTLQYLEDREKDNTSDDKSLEAMIYAMQKYNFDKNKEQLLKAQSGAAFLTVGTNGLGEFIGEYECGEIVKKPCIIDKLQYKVLDPKEMYTRKLTKGITELKDMYSSSIRKEMLSTEIDIKEEERGEVAGKPLSILDTLKDYDYYSNIGIDQYGNGKILSGLKYKGGKELRLTDIMVKTPYISTEDDFEGKKDILKSSILSTGDASPHPDYLNIFQGMVGNQKEYTEIVLKTWENLAAYEGINLGLLFKEIYDDKTLRIPKGNKVTFNKDIRKYYYSEMMSSDKTSKKWFVNYLPLGKEDIYSSKEVGKLKKLFNLLPKEYKTLNVKGTEIPNYEKIKTHINILVGGIDLDNSKNKVFKEVANLEFGFDYENNSVFKTKGDLNSTNIEINSIISDYIDTNEQNYIVVVRDPNNDNPRGKVKEHLYKINNNYKKSNSFGVIFKIKYNRGIVTNIEKIGNLDNSNIDLEDLHSVTNKDVRRSFSCLDGSECVKGS